MYHPQISNRRLAKLQQYVAFPFKHYSVEESIERQEQLNSIYDPDDNRLIRPLKKWEQEFIANELLISKWDYKYWVNRYAFIVTKGSRFIRVDFWESQDIAYRHIANGELKAWLGERPDNLWIWLKARQLGATTIAETMIGHRLFFHQFTRAVIASDIPDHSLELSRKVQTVYDHMPWWMQPDKKFDVKGVEMFFNQLQSALVIGHGSAAKRRGGLGQGSTCQIYHLTEIPDWENWQQIDEDFLPSVPEKPTSVGFEESTARGRNDHFHAWFDLAWKGQGRRQALFIPWYTEQSTYQKRPPENWRPDPLTMAHREEVIRKSPLYCHGKTIRLTPEQMYWYEDTRKYYDETGRLPVFFQEYAADHIGAFQDPSGAFFPPGKLDEALRNVADMRVFNLVSS